MAAPRDHRPAVLIVGGFLTVPIGYRRLRRRLLERGAARVDIAPVWPTHWAAAGAFGFGPLLRRTGRSIAASYRAAGARPIIVVGHSAGGILARLAMSPVPFGGHVAGVSAAVGALVTLGTPHELSSLVGRRRHAGHRAAAFLDRTTPGAFFAPTTGYLTVGSRAVPSRTALRTPVGVLVQQIFAQLLGPDAVRAPGDGIVPAGASHLRGARQLTLDAASHGNLGRGWYGDEAVVDAWWPAAVEAWQDALEAREARRAAPRSPARPRTPRGNPSTFDRRVAMD